MEQCCGITRKGVRCKRHTHFKRSLYGIEIYSCNFHTDQNSIILWSHKGQLEPLTPPRIKNYLNIYWTLSENLDFMRSVPLVMLSTHVYNKNPKEDLTDYLGIRDEFYENSIPARTSGRSNTALAGRCGASRGHHGG